MIGAICTDSVRLLLVEDHPGDANLVNEMLNDAQPDAFQITHVGALRKAIHLLKTSNYQAVLLDLSLPDTYGLETVHSVCEAVPGIPVVVLSSLNWEKLAIQALQAGAEDFLVKGETDGPRLAQALYRAIERHRIVARLRRELEASLSQTERLEDTRRAGTQVHSFLLHDLRMPLLIGRALLDRLGRGRYGAVTEDQKEILELAIRSLSRLSVRVADAIEFNGIELGHMPMQCLKHSVRILAEEAVTTLLPLVPESRAWVRLGDVQEDLWMNCDAGRILQVLLTLGHHALQRNPNAELVISAARIRDRVRIEMRDERKDASGGGAQPADKAAPSNLNFGRADTQDLVLCISRALVEAHGGTLLVDLQAPRNCVASFDLKSAVQ